jgi:hypothetical protein
MAIEERDLQGAWRLVTGETLSGPGSFVDRKVFKEVHGVLGAFAREVEEEGKRVAREEEWNEVQQQQQQQGLEEQLRRCKRGKIA